MIYSLKYVKSGDNQYTGYLMELPGVCSQANSLEELKINIKDALGAMLEILKEEQENEPIVMGWEVAKTIDIEL